MVFVIDLTVFVLYCVDIWPVFCPYRSHTSLVYMYVIHVHTTYLFCPCSYLHYYLTYKSSQCSLCFVINLCHSQVQLDLVQRLWQLLHIKQ